MLAGGGATAVARQVLAETDEASVGLRLSDDVGEAASVICGAAETNDLHRVFLGTGLPGPGGVLPGGMALFMDILVRGTSIGREQLFAHASGNVARAFGLPGGVLDIGAPADVVLIEPAPDGSRPGSAWTRPPTMTFIDGVVAWTREEVG
jgi:enamidase